VVELLADHASAAAVGCVQVKPGSAETDAMMRAVLANEFILLVVCYLFNNYKNNRCSPF
jgi:hypothetical protein